MPLVVRHPAGSAIAGVPHEVSLEGGGLGDLIGVGVDGLETLTLVAGTNITFDDSTPGERVINAAGGGAITFLQAGW